MKLVGVVMVSMIYLLSEIDRSLTRAYVCSDQIYFVTDKSAMNFFLVPK